ncbi:MAG: extensin family protein [Polyangiaceae bacterium]
MVVRPRAAHIVAAVALLLPAVPALARGKKPRVRYEDARTPRASATYAAMTKSACEKELKSRKIAFASAGVVKGVMAPVRLKGALAGVTFSTGLPEKERATSTAEIYDCRLVLSLHDWAKLLAKHGIDEVRTINAYRPEPSAGAEGKAAVRHPAGLAVDVKALGKKPSKEGGARTWLTVETDFRARIGDKVCDEKARSRLPAAARELRAIVCETDVAATFTSILTPGYDRAHRDHLHLEIRPGAQWSMLL